MPLPPLLVCGVLVLMLTGCGGHDDPEGGVDGSLTVLAASSLTDAFTEVAEAFEAERPGVDVELSFDGSSTLAAAIIEGVPADVFASADEQSVQRVVREGHADGARRAFATNRLAIVVAEGNPLGIEGLDDLSGTGAVVSLCEADLPCGRYAGLAFERAGSEVPPAGREDSVRGVLTKVALGEADAGLVYVTDVRSSAGVEGIDLAADQQVTATYPAVVLSDAPNPEGAAAFLAFLTGHEAQGILADHGFGPP